MDNCPWLFAIHQITTNSFNLGVVGINRVFEDYINEKVIKRKTFPFSCFLSFWIIQGKANERAVDFFILAEKK